MGYEYSVTSKLARAKQTAKCNGCFVVEIGDYDNKRYLVYRESSPRNLFQGKRTSIEGLVRFVEKVVSSK